MDEVGDLDIALQAKLLRVLQDRTFERLGGTKTITVDVRVIAASNADLKKATEKKQFREDLFYRLSVFPITIPPLRERTEDVPELAGYFVKKYCSEMKKAKKSISKEAIALLEKYHWPGNVRELENTIERAVLLNRTDTIGVADLGENIHNTPPVGVVQEAQPATPTLESIEKAYIHYIMSQTDGKKTKAARILGIDTSTLYRKLERYDLKETSAPRADKPRKHSETK